MLKYFFNELWEKDKDFNEKPQELLSIEFEEKTYILYECDVDKNFMVTIDEKKKFYGKSFLFNTYNDALTFIFDKLPERIKLIKK